MVESPVCGLDEKNLCYFSFCLSLVCVGARVDPEAQSKADQLRDVLGTIKASLQEKVDGMMTSFFWNLLGKVSTF